LRLPAAETELIGFAAGSPIGVEAHAVQVSILRVRPPGRKRRPKPFPLMTKPRAEARQEVRLNGHPKKQR
jgi:hypothetical protein